VWRVLIAATQAAKSPPNASTKWKQQKPATQFRPFRFFSYRVFACRGPSTKNPLGCTPSGGKPTRRCLCGSCKDISAFYISQFPFTCASPKQKRSRKRRVVSPGNAVARPVNLSNLGSRGFTWPGPSGAFRLGERTTSPTRPRRPTQLLVVSIGSKSNFGRLEPPAGR